eukprot:7339459-Heterocapsa_arctica.AAC.1
MNHSEQNNSDGGNKKINPMKDSVLANNRGSEQIEEDDSVNILQVFQVSGPDGADPLAGTDHMNPDHCWVAVRSAHSMPCVRAPKQNN